MIDYHKKEYEVEGNKEKSEKALETALDIRKFEIEMYWKRATYFWVFISVTFAAYFSILKTDFPDSQLILVLVSYVGSVFSLSWYLVNRGSKFWQKNWESHVDNLEDQHIGPLYKLMLDNRNCKGNLLSSYPFSVSRINIAISLFILIIWFFLNALSIKGYIIDGYEETNLFFWILTGIFILFIYMLLFKMESSKTVDKSGFKHRGDKL